MHPNAIPFHPKLPSRIAGIVFWALVLVSLILALNYLNKVESEIDRHRESDVYYFVHEVKQIIDQVETIDEVREVLDYRIKSLHKDMIFSSARIIGHGHEYINELEFGIPNDDDDVLEQNITYQHDGVERVHQVIIEVYFPSKEKAVANIRKNMFLGIGIGIFLFGLFLRYVLHVMLTQPFISMLETAKGFTIGKELLRFNESRQDEFGYLGRFINNALESVLEQQELLVMALERASASEVALSVEKEMAEVTLYSITDSVMTVDQVGTVTFINPAAEKLLNLTLEEAVGKNLPEVFNVVDESSKPLVVDPVKECFSQGGIVNFPEQSSLLDKSSALIAIEASVAPMKNDAGDLLGAVVVVQNVSHTRKLTRQLSYQASHDSLTGLYNRRKFESHLQESLSNAEGEDRRHVLLYIDLDQFKIVNDTCGHIAGDELLQQLPLIFHKVLRAGDVVARLGGDEFGVLLENCSLDKSIVIADKIREQVKDFRFVWEDKTFEIGVSIGVVAIDPEHLNMTSILSSADVACYAAKDAGRNRVHVYEESDIALSRRHGEMHWTSRITKALEEDRFCLYQQNITNVKSGAIEHIEVLIRMIDEDGSIILPGSFLPAAERFNLMSAIDRWVISHAFKIMGEANADSNGQPVTMMAINLSGDSLNDDSLLDFIYSEKDAYNVSLGQICFEITETVAISNLNHAVSFIEELKRHDCKFALDDFGSGLSSFAYLKSLPVDYLKIDGSFVRNIGRDEIDKAMVQSIQQVAEAMNLLTIAEWVEDERTMNVLKELGVDCVQGNYLMSPSLVTCETYH